MRLQNKDHLCRFHKKSRKPIRYLRVVYDLVIKGKKYTKLD